MTIAVDFDGTLCRNEYPRIGGANLPLIDHLIKRQRGGDTLILWTCREGLLLREAVAWCASFGLVFNYVNENSDISIERYGGSRKVYADLYIDDKSCLPDALVKKRSRYGGRTE